VNSGQLFAFITVFGVAFLTAFTLTPLARRFGLAYRIVDTPAGRRQHQGSIPRTGGLALYAAFTLAILVAQVMPVERTDSKEIIRFFGLWIGGTFVTILGYIDDRFELTAIQQYIGQVIAGGIAILFLIFIETFNNPFTGNTAEPFPYWFTVTLTLLWMGLMMNTVNFLDGSDGLAAGVTGIAALMIFIHAAFRLDQVSVGLLALALVGTVAGFLPYNFHPAKIFMGGGAPFLGYVLGVLSIIGGAKMATILLVMGLPLVDAAWQASSRLLRGQNPMQGDRGHLHFRLIDAGVSPKIIALGYYAFCTCFGVIALTTTSRLFKLLAMGVMFLIVALVFAIVPWLKRQPKGSL
jgi:UDP-GlcNAc:undecaprenyl-phosphate GlcNAc-1-phosphate transferase